MTQCDSCVLQLAHHFTRCVPKQMPSHGQAWRYGIAINQRDAYPVLQRAYSAAECGLRDISGVSCPGEARHIGQNQKVFKPFDIHGGSNPERGVRTNVLTRIIKTLTSDWRDCNLISSLRVGGWIADAKPSRADHATFFKFCHAKTTNRRATRQAHK